MPTNVYVGGSVSLPSGVTVEAGRETSQVNSQGTVVQGMVFPLKLTSGTMTSVFVPYSLIENTAAVQALIDKRVAAITAITG